MVRRTQFAPEILLAAIAVVGMASASFARADQLHTVLNAYTKMMDRTYQIGKMTNDPAAREQISNVAYQVTGKAVRNSMFTALDQKMRADDDRRIKSFQNLPQFKNAQAIDSAVRKGIKTNPPPPMLGKGTAPKRGNLVGSATGTGPGAGAQTAAPEKPKLILDGSKVPREVEFSGPKTNGSH